MSALPSTANQLYTDYRNAEQMRKERDEATKQPENLPRKVCPNYTVLISLVLIHFYNIKVAVFL